MSIPVVTAIEARAAFDELAASYDEVFTDSSIGRAQRACVWREIDRCFQPGQRIIEINCGTGADALHLARRGVRVVACDASPEMIARAVRRVAEAGLATQVEFQVFRTERLRELRLTAPFDGALSNFAGLNCLEDLAGVAANLARLVRPGGAAVLCVFGRYCLWEMIWYLGRGEPGKAFRRLGRKGSIAHLGPSNAVGVHYPSLRRLKRLFAPHFRLSKWQGVGVVVPPSYVEPLAARHPRAFQKAAGLEQWLNRLPIARSAADHLLLTFERTAN